MRTICLALLLAACGGSDETVADDIGQSQDALRPLPGGGFCASPNMCLDCSRPEYSACVECGGGGPGGTLGNGIVCCHPGNGGTCLIANGPRR
jgi:hypothetical protein